MFGFWYIGGEAKKWRDLVKAMLFICERVGRIPDVFDLDHARVDNINSTII
jgi:hypothetical protein